MDFSILDDGGLKCFEYNADSASCLLECGLSQGAWMTAAGQGNSGVDAGVGLFEMLVYAWQRLGLPSGSTVHFLHDGETDEEKYHTLYMMSAAERVGLVCKRYATVDGFTYKAGCPVDADGVLVTHVWKTWSYATLLDRWQGQPLRTDGTPDIHSVILNENVRVFEPLWTAVTGNKAILPILSQLYPMDPHLLFTTTSLTPELLKDGFAAKPTQGRCGENVSIHRPKVGDDGQSHDAVTVELKGRFGDNELVYQELAVLPKINGLHVQINSFVAGEGFAGLVTRVDASAIMNVESECTSLRVVADGSGVQLPTVETVLAAKEH
jgi:glutathionylspermidine amidase/synthetase